MSSLRFKGPAAYVSDLERSRAFYEGLLGLHVQRVMRRNGRDIALAYEEGISTWLVSDAYEAIFGDASEAPAALGAGNWENTFESPEFEAIYARLTAAGATFAHELRELPWGQRGSRVYDPDGHIIDISENHGALVRRLLAGGMSREAIREQVSISEAQFDAFAAGKDDF